MDLLVQVQDSEAPFLMELLAKFDFVNVKQADEAASVAGLKRSINQLNDMRVGKLRKPPVSELFETDD